MVSYIYISYNNNIIIRAYNVDDLYHTGRIDQPGMVKIVYIVYTCILTIIITIIVLQSKTAARCFFVTFFFFLFSLLVP